MGNNNPKLSPIPVTDPIGFLNDYSGIWYEVAAIPFRYERGCIGVVAFYHDIDPDRKMFSVTNFCIKEKETTYSDGKAEWLPGCNDARLFVNFTDKIPPFVKEFLRKKGNYWIVEYEKGTFSVVSDFQSKQLWILARDPNFYKTENFDGLFEKYNKLFNGRIVKRTATYNGFSTNLNDKKQVYFTENKESI